MVGREVDYPEYAEYAEYTEYDEYPEDDEYDFLSAAEPARDVVLVDTDECAVTRVAHLQRAGFFAAACVDHAVRVYRTSSSETSYGTGAGTGASASVKPLYLLRGAHKAAVRDVTALDDGSTSGLIASVSEDGTLCTWDAKRGTLVDTLVLARHQFTAVACVNSDTIATGDEAGNLCLIRHTNGKRVKRVMIVKSAHRGRVNCISAFAEGRFQFVVSGGDDGVCNVHDEKMDFLDKFDLSSQVTGIACSRDHIAACCADGTLYTINTLSPTSFKPNYQLTDVDLVLNSVSFFDLDTLMLTSISGAVIFFSFSEKATTARVAIGNGTYLLDACKLNDGRVVAAGLSAFCALFTPPPPISDSQHMSESPIPQSQAKPRILPEDIRRNYAVPRNRHGRPTSRRRTPPLVVRRTSFDDPDNGTVAAANNGRSRSRRRQHDSIDWESASASSQAPSPLPQAPASVPSRTRPERSNRVSRGVSTEETQTQSQIPRQVSIDDIVVTPEGRGNRNGYGNANGNGNGSHWDHQSSQTARQPNGYTTTMSRHVEGMFDSPPHLHSNGGPEHEHRREPDSQGEAAIPKPSLSLHMPFDHEFDSPVKQKKERRVAFNLGSPPPPTNNNHRARHSSSARTSSGAKPQHQQYQCESVDTSPHSTPTPQTATRNQTLRDPTPSPRPPSQPPTRNVFQDQTEGLQTESKKEVPGKQEKRTKRVYESALDADVGVDDDAPTPIVSVSTATRNSVAERDVEMMTSPPRPSSPQPPVQAPFVPAAEVEVESKKRNPFQAEHKLSVDTRPVVHMPIAARGHVTVPSVFSPTHETPPEFPAMDMGSVGKLSESEAFDDMESDSAPSSVNLKRRVIVQTESIRHKALARDEETIEDTMPSVKAAAAIWGERIDSSNGEVIRQPTPSPVPTRAAAAVVAPLRARACTNALVPEDDAGSDEFVDAAGSFSDFHEAILKHGGALSAHGTLVEDPASPKEDVVMADVAHESSMPSLRLVSRKNGVGGVAQEKPRRKTTAALDSVEDRPRTKKSISGWDRARVTANGLVRAVSRKSVGVTGPVRSRSDLHEKRARATGANAGGGLARAKSNRHGINRRATSAGGQLARAVSKKRGIEKSAASPSDNERVSRNRSAAATTSTSNDDQQEPANHFSSLLDKWRNPDRD